MLKELTHYIWWQPAEVSLGRPERLIAQVMDLGDCEDECALEDIFGDAILRSVIEHAEAGSEPPRRYTNGCIVVSVGRTNIEIDGDLVSEAMRRYGLHSKRAAVDLALRRLVGESMSREEALEMEGAGWEGDLDEMRRDRQPVG